MPDYTITHVVECQLAMFVGRPLDHGSDQAHSARSLQGKDSQKVGPAEIDVDFSVRRRARPLDVSHVENVGIGTAGKARRQNLPHG